MKLIVFIMFLISSISIAQVIPTCPCLTNTTIISSSEILHKPSSIFTIPVNKFGIDSWSNEANARDNSGLSSIPTSISSLTTITHSSPSTINNTAYLSDGSGIGDNWVFAFSNPVNLSGVAMWIPCSFAYGGGDSPIKKIEFSTIGCSGNIIKDTIDLGLPDQNARIIDFNSPYLGVTSFTMNIIEVWYQPNEDCSSFVVGTSPIQFAYNVTLGEIIFFDRGNIGSVICANCPVSITTPSIVCGGAGSSICGPTNMLSYNWQTPMGTTSTASCITASSAGIYTLLVVPTNIQCSAAPTFTYMYGVSENPTIHISSNGVCLNSTTSFTNTSTVPAPDVITTWEWDFENDGTIDDNTIAPNHLYTAIGTYTVGLIATATSGCKSTATIQTIVYDNPSASFVFTEACFNQATNITSSSNGNGSPITNHAWDFTGDNIADITAPNTLNYTMPLSGNNTVNYTVTTTPEVGLTCKSSTTQIVVTQPIPQAAFVFTNNCINNQPNYFDATNSTVSSGTIDDYVWDFGDTQTDNSPLPTTNHNYNLPITYNVMLTVTSDKGCIDTETQQVEVYPLPLISILSNQKVCLGSSSTFTAQMLPNSGNVVSWSWDVNNTLNTIEYTGQQGSHVYSTEGWQVLNVVATTNHGCVETITRNVYVNYIPKPEFIVDDPEGCPLPHCVIFTDQTPAFIAPAQVVNWAWSFGNGISVNTLSSSNQSQCYTNTSTNQLALYSVTLTTQTDSGCVASNIKSNFITVYPTPLAQYTVVPEFGNVVVPLVHFINQSVDYTTVSWSFGDGNKDNININPNHTYEGTEVNEYYTSLIVANQYGCIDTAKLVVPITPDFVFYIPNAFSPNEDVRNDGFTGMGIGIAKYEMWIYNRWGTQIYYTDDIYKAWNGKIQGRNEEAKQDVYTWKVELKDIFGKKHNYVGHVTLLR